jgi:hemerythrin-like domain-containing protein
MEFLKALEAEHRLIDGVTRALEVFAPRFDGTAENLHEMIRFITFLRGYADGYHHDREEAVLLPALVAAGFNADVGPVAHVRDLHREEVRLLLRFEMAASARMPWEAEAVRAMSDAALALVAFTRDHMVKEQTLLFPAAEKELQTGTHPAQLDALVQRFERRRAPRWDVPWLERLGAELITAHPLS